MASDTGKYEGRLVCDGYGNLLADEGDRAGEPVAYHEGSYIFINPGDKSHNERHEQNVIPMTMTVDESMTEDSELVNAEPDGDNPHHFTVQEDDPHYDEDAPNNIRLRFDPDKVAARVTGHTDAYKGRDR